MTVCDEVTAAVLGHLSEGWTCRPLGEGRFLVAGSGHYSDGDAAEVLAQVADGDVTVSDGGEALARLELAGVSVDSGRAREMWLALIRAHGLDLVDGRLYRHGTVSELGTLTAVMVEALVNLDGIRLLAPTPRRLPFAEELVTFLQAEFEHVEEHVELRGRSGSAYRVTAAAGRPDQPVFVQALAGNTPQARQRAAEHGFVVFSDVDGTLLPRQKLIVLGGSVGQWNAGRLGLLSQVAYVGSWRGRDRLIDFIGGQVAPAERLLLDSSEQTELNSP
jgi:hypothetical protein